MVYYYLSIVEDECSFVQVRYCTVLYCAALYCAVSQTIVAQAT